MIQGTQPFPIIIYQMGKVGSASVQKSLKASNHPGPVFHIHRLSWQSLKRANELKPLPSHLLKSCYLRGLLDARALNPPWRVITLVRDPVARAISGFFQNIETHPEFEGLGPHPERYDIDKLLECCLQQCRYQKNEVDWFDYELGDALGIDVYQTPFPVGQGFQCYETSGIKLLLIRLENLNDDGAQAIRSFLNMDDFELLSQNRGHEKWYAGLYQEFLSRLRLPRQYLDDIYSTKLVRHFYSEPEINALRMKWDRDRMADP